MTRNDSKAAKAVEVAANGLIDTATARIALAVTFGVAEAEDGTGTELNISMRLSNDLTPESTAAMWRLGKAIDGAIKAAVSSMTSAPTIVVRDEGNPPSWLDPKAKA